MQKNELKTGQILRGNVSVDLYLVVDGDNGKVININRHGDGELDNVFVIENFSLYDVWIDNVVSLLHMDKPQPNKSIYIVTANVDSGMVFSNGDNELYTFDSFDKAERCFDAIKKNWHERLLNNYRGAGDEVTIKTFSDKEVEIYANEFEDLVHIKMFERHVQ